MWSTNSPLLRHIQHQLTNDIPVLVRLSKVRIFPNAIVHKKNETLLGTLTDQMPFQGKGAVEAPRISPVKGRLFKSGLRKRNCMTFILFSLRWSIGWLFHCLTTTASILKITILTGKYLGWKYCAKYSSRRFSFMSSQPVIAGLCFIKWRCSRFSKKILLHLLTSILQTWPSCYLQNLFTKRIAPSHLTNWRNPMDIFGLYDQQNKVSMRLPLFTRRRKFKSLDCWICCWKCMLCFTDWGLARLGFHFLMCVCVCVCVCVCAL